MMRPRTDPLYLDANAGLPALPVALQALADAAGAVGNPSSTHVFGRRARALLDRAREQVAAALGGSPRELVFTSGASEANRWLVEATRGKRVVSSMLEHPSLAKPLGAVPGLDDVAAAEVLFCTAAHNETGIVPDLAALLARVPAGCIVCVDAAQAVARLPPLPPRVDAVVASAHKIGGLSGAGALLLRGNARSLAAPWAGGGQEAGLRPGTEALALQAAFGAAAAVVDETRAAHARLGPLRDRLEAALADAWGDVEILGRGGPRLANTTALVVKGADGDALRIAIDAAGVAVGFGSACSALAPEPSPALLALGVSAADARATVRLSLPPGATDADVDEAIARLRPLAGVIERSRARRRAP